MFGFKIVAQCEQGLVFRWGGALPGIRSSTVLLGPEHAPEGTYW